jgi:hypothetical protein
MADRTKLDPSSHPICIFALKMRFTLSAWMMAATSTKAGAWVLNPIQYLSGAKKFLDSMELIEYAVN